jgi:uncharacterized membrane protein YhhN
MVAACFAAGNWWSRLRHDRRLELVTKPATIAALVVAAIALDPAPGADTRRTWFVVALVWSLAGDVALMLPGRFVAGLAAFLVGHLAYVAGFWTRPPGLAAVAVAAVVVAVPVGALAARLVRALRASGERGLVAPVLAYVVVIGAMVVSALASGNAVAGAGAALFATSDALIAWDRFVAPWRPAAVTIMVTYHVAQALLVLSLVVGG